MHFTNETIEDADEPDDNDDSDVDYDNANGSKFPDTAGEPAIPLLPPPPFS